MEYYNQEGTFERKKTMKEVLTNLSNVVNFYQIRGGGTILKQGTHSRVGGGINFFYGH